MTRVHSDAKGVSVPACDVPATFAKVLTGAADLISKPGAWTRTFTARGPIKETNPPVSAACLATADHANEWGALGAIFAVGRAAGLRNADCYSIGRRVGHSIGCGDRLTEWAGQPERTAAQIAAAFRKAAKATTASAVGTEAEGRSAPNPTGESAQ